METMLTAGVPRMAKKMPAAGLAGRCKRAVDMFKQLGVQTRQGLNEM